MATNAGFFDIFSMLFGWWNAGEAIEVELNYYNFGTFYITQSKNITQNITQSKNITQNITTLQDKTYHIAID